MAVQDCAAAASEKNPPDVPNSQSLSFWQRTAKKRGKSVSRSNSFHLGDVRMEVTVQWLFFSKTTMTSRGKQRLIQGFGQDFPEGTRTGRHERGRGEANLPVFVGRFWP